MSTYNHVTLIGFLEDKPRLKKVGKKTKTEFKLSVPRYKKNSSDPYETDIFNIVAWGKLAQICEEHLDKSNKVLVDGKIQVTKTDTEIVLENMKFLSKKRG